MKETPILFSAPMVRAILAGTKTQTRRLVKPCKQLQQWGAEPSDAYEAMMADDRRSVALLVSGDHGFTDWIDCPFGGPGDRLWVRETWCYAHPDYHDEAEGRRLGDRPVREYPPPWWCHYAATDAVDHAGGRSPWKPSIHMPRWASRITLEVTDVRVERVQDISEADAKAKGVEFTEFGLGDGWSDEQRIIGERARTKGTHPHTLSFAVLWDTINGDRASWESNPLVWVVGFRRLEP